MRSSYSRRRKKNRGAAMIILVSTLAMVLLLVVFFTAAMRAGTAAPDEGGTESTAADRPETDPLETSGKDPISVQPPDTALQTDDRTAAEPIVTDTAAVTVPETEAVTQSPPAYTPPEIIPVTFNAELLAEVALPEGEMPAGYVDTLVFYGDSTTHGMKAYKVFGSRDTKQVWTPTSGTLALFRAATDLVYDPGDGKEKSLTDLCRDNKPQRLIMTLGVNGISFMSRDDFKASYQTLIDMIRGATPDTILILQSIYPVARSYAKQESINNKKIQAANEWIVELAKENSLPYLNTYSVLVGDDGYLPESYQNGDGMHFNETGFAAVMEYVKAHPAV